MNIEQAIKIFEQRIAHNGEDAKALYSLGVCYSELGKHQEAVSFYKKAIACDKENFEAYHNIGVSYQSLGLLEEAKTSYQSAISVKGDFFASYKNLGIVLLLQKNYKESLRVFLDAAKLLPKNAQIYLLIGDSLSKLGLLDKAIQVYQKNLMLDENNFKGLMGLGHVYINLRDFNKAKECFDKVLDMDITNEDAHNALKLINNEINRFQAMLLEEQKKKEEEERSVVLSDVGSQEEKDNELVAAIKFNESPSADDDLQQSAQDDEDDLNLIQPEYAIEDVRGIFINNAKSFEINENEVEDNPSDITQEVEINGKKYFIKKDIDNIQNVPSKKTIIPEEKEIVEEVIIIEDIKQPEQKPEPAPEKKLHFDYWATRAGGGLGEVKAENESKPVEPPQKTKPSTTLSEVEAVKFYQTAISVNPDDYKSFLLLGINQARLGHHQQAIESFKRSIRINPSNPFSYYHLGLSSKKLGLEQDAIDSFKKAVSIKLDYSEAYFSLGNVYSSQKMHDEAIDVYKKVIEINPNDYRVYCNLGHCYDSLGINDEAIESYKAALEIKPDYDKALFNIGVSYSKLGMTREAIEYYKIALRVNPDYVEAQFNLGLCYGELGMQEESTMAFKNVVDQHSDGEEVDDDEIQDVQDAYDSAIEIESMPDVGSNGDSN